MRRITKLTGDARQKFDIIGEKGEQIPFEAFFMPTQQLWTFNIGYSTFQVNGAQLVVGVNILRNYRRNIPFGLAIATQNGQDPAYIDDFSSGRAQVFLLNAAEVEQIEKDVFE